MKGQYVTVEALFFFTMGVSMALITFVIFLDFSDTIRKANTESQIGRVGDFITSSIAEVYLAGNITNSSLRLDIPVPEQVSGCIYQITAKDSLVLNCTGTAFSNVLSLYGIETKVKNGAAYSSNGKITLSYSSGRVELYD